MWLRCASLRVYVVDHRKVSHMTDDERAAFILEHRMGFPPSETGRYVSELRAHVRKQVSEGMCLRSGGTWSDECYTRDGNGFITGFSISHEDRARAILQMDWEMERGRSRCMNLVDSAPIMWRFNTRTMCWRLEFAPRYIKPWLQDRFGWFGYRWRTWRNRNLKNPYRA